MAPVDQNDEGTATRTRRSHALVPIGLFGGIALLIAADLASDYHDSFNIGRVHGLHHLVLEALAAALALVGSVLFARHAWSLHRAADDLGRDLRAAEAEARRWRTEAQQALESFGAAIGREFEKWGLTVAEREIALLLLRGLSHKEIAAQRRTSEGTVRQQALSIYRKSGLGGRSNLAAFFLEGVNITASQTSPPNAT
jgi:DNA-binding CsgD family transcriptional regulator